jgi:hypothetical protein
MGVRFIITLSLQETAASLYYSWLKEMPDLSVLSYMKLNGTISDHTASIIYGSGWCSGKASGTNSGGI